VRILPGQEAAGIDIFLTKVHTVRIRGRVTSALSGKVVGGPSISLRWNDADNTGSITAPADVSFDINQNFEIRGVAPGPYLIVTTGADDGKALSGRTPVHVGEDDIAELGILIGPDRKWAGKIKVEGDESTQLSGMTVTLDPRRTTAFPSRAISSDKNEFAIQYVPQETYDLFLGNLPEDAYLKSIHVSTADALASGLEAEPGDDPPPIDIVVSTRGGKLLGKAVTTDSTIVASGATVLLIPDPIAGRIQTYRTTFADEYGNFLVRGLAPGHYLVVAWLDQPPCEVYNPDDLANCRLHGAGVTISESVLESLQVTAN